MDRQKYSENKDYREGYICGNFEGKQAAHKYFKQEILYIRNLCNDLLKIIEHKEVDDHGT